MFACDHIGLFTNNYKGLLSFYKKLGFREEKKEILPKSIVKKIFNIQSECIFGRLVSGNVKIELFQLLSAKSKRKQSGYIGYDHWGYCVGDVEKFCRSLKRKKIKIIEVKRNSHRVYFIKDPDGNLIEIRH